MLQQMFPNANIYVVEDNKLKKEKKDSTFAEDLADTFYKMAHEDQSEKED